MGNPVEIKALFFTLMRGSPGAEIVFLNQNLPIRPTTVCRDFNAHFLGTLTHRLFDFVQETRDPLRLLEFYSYCVSNREFLSSCGSGSCSKGISGGFWRERR
jgi:hypothetical protein